MAQEHSPPSAQPQADIAENGVELSHPMALDGKEREILALSAAAPVTWEGLVLPLEDEPCPEPGVLGRILCWSWLPARLLTLVWMTYVLIFNLSVVRGSSMAPGIQDGDRIVVDPLSYVFTDIARGDIVVLSYPLNPELDYIKRVVGLPGDVISMAAGKLKINGEVVEESYTLEQDPYTQVYSVVKPGHYYVLGDNRLHSSDSREFGQVRADLVRGKVDLRLWPFDRIGLLD